MSKPRIIHPDEHLRFAAKYFIYHLKMYVETLLILQSHRRFDEWDTVRNAVLETHLVHARVLINFIFNYDGKDTDVLAVDYFHDALSDYPPLQDDFLNSQVKSIGGQLVHLTTKAIPILKSEQEWDIRGTAAKLIPTLKDFLSRVAESRFSKDINTKCLEQLAKLSPSEMPISVSSST